MNVSHRQLQAFITLARSTNYAEAAEKLFITQPALSLAIKKMEQQLGGELFSRTTRTVTLSPEGEAFLPNALRLLHDWEATFDDVKNLLAMNRGKLTIAAMPSFASSLLPQMITKFHPKSSNVNYTILDLVMEETLSAVLQGRAELGFTFKHEQMEGLDYHAMFDDKFIAVINQTHPLRARQQVNWRDISQFPVVATNRGSSIRRWLENYMKEANLSLNIVAEANQLATIGQFVHAGMGMSIVPGICQQSMSNKGLLCLPLVDKALTRSLCIIKARRRSLSVPAAALWRWVTTQSHFELI